MMQIKTIKNGKNILYILLFAFLFIIFNTRESVVLGADNYFNVLDGLTCSGLDPLATSANTGEKPQSKVWTYAGDWWAALPATTPTTSSDGTWLWKLEGSTWVDHFKLSDNLGTAADVKSMGAVTHIFIYGSAPELVSVEYSGGAYQLWTSRVAPSPITLTDSEIATIDIDSTGRMWLATQAGADIVVYYSDSPYSSWSGPVTLATGVDSDDISVVTALPNNTVGVMWSNQDALPPAFGFRVHADGADPATWSAGRNGRRCPSGKTSTELSPIMG